VEVLTDVDDFWTWLHSPELADLLFSSQAPNPVELDLDRIITAGESAGGLLSIYLGLSYPDDGIRAITATYPMLNLDPPSVYPATPTKLFPNAPESVIDEHLQRITPDAVVSSVFTSERVLLMAAACAHHRLIDFYTGDAGNSPSHRDRLFQLHRLDQPGTKLPRGGIVILHGEEDDLVHVESSRRFVDKAGEVFKGKQGGDRVVLAVRPGGHGFDGAATLEKDQWLRDALKGAVEVWLE
jgi:acetyl esterase/lipase